jgi:hypothetical protein
MQFIKRIKAILIKNDRWYFRIYLVKKVCQRQDMTGTV